ncbi:hypothetical protein [Exiguobacterium qingdaonense]|uniref:hypothetical protein n=1 Tax=Exiguobacterium qingdaonense TaxID=2751251 RepID=UPI001BE7C6FA|nr:hypothetical protein [Exiguobacterium qingdaonense]
MKRFLGKCVEYALAALTFAGLFFVLRLIADDTDKGYMLTLFGSFFLVLPSSLLIGYLLARPLQRRLEGKGTRASNDYTLRGTEKPHGVNEDRNHSNYTG